jgi:Arc/MetJ family transcription regulator
MMQHLAPSIMMLASGMRTTVDLPDDLHALAMAIARDSGASLSDTVTRLLRVAVGSPGPVRVSTSRRTGLKVVSTGGTVTSDDVRALEDEG